jgi:hypothetical protein
MELETLVFHELGIVYGRAHNTDTLPNGDPKSIMVPNKISLYSVYIPIGNQPCDNGFKRPYYLDELFNPQTAAPDWSK